jgi:molybdopterin synthase sulfur carrier subunit
MPRVQVNLYAALRAYAGGAPSVDVEITAGQTIGQVLETLGVPPGHTRIIFIDNRPGDLAQSLQGGEQLGIFPAIGGG